MLELIIIIVYFLAVIVIGLTGRRKFLRMEEYMVAGRQYSTFFISGSLMATIIGGSATVGLAGLGFSRGLVGAWWLLVSSIGLVILGLFFARKVRSAGAYTLPELITRQYDRRVGLAASVLIATAWVGVTAGQILAAGKILSVLGIGSPVLWMVIFTLIFVGYTIFGGQYAIIRTDILDIVLIFTGILAGLGVLLWQTGGIEGLAAALPADHFSFPLSLQFEGVDLASYLLLIGLVYVVGPDLYARLFCARDGKTARKATLWSALLLAPFAFGIVLLGMGALVKFPGIAAEQAFPALITGVLPAAIAGLVLAALVSAVMSSASATLWSTGTIFTVNIIGHFRQAGGRDASLRSSRWVLLAMGLAALGLALALNGVITALLFAYTIYTCGVILPVIAGFYKDRLGVTSNAALAAIIGGGLAGLASKIWEIKYLDLGALAVSLLLLTAVSLLENRIRSRSNLPKAAIQNSK
ncbi:MAG: sodium:solute symporter family protein [Dehalococcoidales bacterium]|nr:sodium:solute symporter family protein [Dehalococcoidales bacterium]